MGRCTGSQRYSEVYTELLRPENTKRRRLDLNPCALSFCRAARGGGGRPDLGVQCTDREGDERRVKRMKRFIGRKEAASRARFVNTSPRTMQATFIPHLGFVVMVVDSRYRIRAHVRDQCLAWGAIKTEAVLLCARNSNIACAGIK